MSYLKNHHLISGHEGLLLCLLLRVLEFLLLHLGLWSLLNYFLSGVRMGSSFIHLHVAIWLFQHNLLKKLLWKRSLFPRCFFLALLLKIKWPYSFISKLSILLHSPVSILILVVDGLDYCNFVANLKIRMCESFKFVFFIFKDYLAILGIVYSHMNFRSILSIFAKKKKITCDFFYRDCVESVDKFRSSFLLTMLSLPIQEHMVSFHLFRSSLISSNDVL